MRKEFAGYFGRHRRLLLLLSRFAVVTASILLLTYVLTYAADSLRAYAFTGLLWQTSQKRAQLALSRCLAHRNLEQYADFEREAATMKALSRAIQEGGKQPRDSEAIRTALLEAHISPSDADSIVRFSWLMMKLHSPFIRRNQESGARAARRVQRQIDVGTAIKQELESPAPNGARLDEMQHELEVIDAEAERDAQEFLARMRSLVHQTTMVLLLTVACGTFAVFYLIFAEMRGMVRRLLTAETSLHERDEQLNQARKLDAIGRFAAGVAHDFNNLLMVISSATEMIEGHLPAASPQRALAGEILDATTRGSSLTRQLLAFSRKQVTEPQILKLDTLVEDNTQFIRHLIGDHIELKCSLKAGSATLEIDPTQFTQVLLNLSANARDAMPKGGVLSIHTRPAGPREVPPMPESTAGYVLMEVSDQGSGMDDETKLHIFEPFFSTKGMGRGSGLGLSTVYGIVKQCNGAITLESQLHQGTVFRLYFPRSRSVMLPQQEPGLKPQVVGGETVLLVEDQDMLRGVAATALELGGYRVITARNGEDAIEVAQRHVGPIHLLLTDVVMPKLSGRELAGHLRPLRPGIKVIYMSGYAPPDLFENGVIEPGAAFLQKPCSLRSMLLKVRQMLDASPQGKSQSA